MTMTIRAALTGGAALAVTAALGLPAQAQEKREAPAVSEQAGPTTNGPDGKAKTALPEQDVSPRGTGERPGSAASRKADEMK